MKKILVPIDFSEPSIEALKFAISVAKQSKGSITLLHAIDLPVTVYGASIDMPIYTYDIRLVEDLKKDAMAKYRKWMNKVGKGFEQVKFIVKQGPVFAVLKEYIESKRLDLVIMGTHGATGLTEFFVGSNTEKVVRFSKVPVVAIRKAVPLSSIKNIVFPTSLEAGQSAFIKKAKEVQQFFGARLHLLYVNTPLNFMRDNEVQEFAKRYQLTNCTVNIRNDRYEPDGILSFVEEIKADMLVMPTHAREGIAHLLRSSITESVVNHAQCPVWTYALKK